SPIATPLPRILALSLHDALPIYQKRKILGGVCSGLGNYLNIDPLWIRLLFAAFAFAWGITIIVYIVMWIVVPGSYDLSEPETTRSEEHTSELQSRENLVCRLLLE